MPTPSRSVRSHQPLLAAALLLACVVGCQQTTAARREVVVGGTDYGFDAPAKLAAGPASFRFVNRGRVPHEMALGQLHAGVTADSVLAYAATGRDPGELAKVVGILIANPGDTAIGALSATLLPGRTYIMICSFRDADSLPPHIAMGMQKSFEVQ